MSLCVLLLQFGLGIVWFALMFGKAEEGLYGINNLFFVLVPSSILSNSSLIMLYQGTYAGPVIIVPEHPMTIHEWIFPETSTLTTVPIN